MRASYAWAGAALLYVWTGVAGNAQILWREPAPLSMSDWVFGPGGEHLAPRPPFEFVKENLGGTNPKIDVTDADGRKWVVKFGGEVHSETFAARLLQAAGYEATPTFFVASGTIEKVQGVKRAKPFLMKDGSFRNARFKLSQHHKRQWSWAENPFVGSRELGGLKILVMLLANWDTKDSRDGDGSNNGVFDAHGDVPAWYAVTDWGASLGRSGGFFERDRWNWRGYSAQTRNFAKLGPDGMIRWGFRGKHGEDITAGVGVQDVQWLVPYLSRITDEQLTAGLTASGASAGVAQEYTRAIRSRVQQLQRIAKPGDFQEVGSR